jgi:rod shape-determining protein MreB
MGRGVKEFIYGIFGGFFSEDLGIDLGTCNAYVYAKGKGIILSEPSVVAVRKGTNRVLLDGKAVGKVAKEMLGKTPGNIQVVRPLRNGVISDFDMAEALIGYLIQKARGRRRGIMPQVVISIPSGITEVEKRAVTNSAERAGARRIFLIEEPLAAGIGAKLPIQDPVGSLIVDIGGGTTEVAVISLGGLVASQSIRIAGDEMDEAVVSHLKKNYNLAIGELTAERIKIEIGSAHPLEEEKTMEVKGKDLFGALPRKVNVTSQEIREALKEPVGQIINTIKATLEGTPAELHADLVYNGITLCGGGSLLVNIDKAIQKEIEVPVRIAEDPQTCVVRGTGVIIENLDAFKEALESEEEIL